MAGKAESGATPDRLDLEGFIEAAGVSRETAERFEAWRVLLEKWRTRINLIGASTADDFWRRHALDSVQLAAFAPPAPPALAPPLRWVDLGSGAGFPGLALALALEGAGRADAVTLVESSRKKAAFLREAARVTVSGATVYAGRIEDLAAAEAKEQGGGFDVVVARACAPLTRLLGYAVSLWKQDTVGVFLKGRDAEAELTLAAKSWRFQFDLQPSRSDPDGRVVLIKRLEHVRSS